MRLRLIFSIVVCVAILLSGCTLNDSIDVGTTNIKETDTINDMSQNEPAENKNSPTLELEIRRYALP